MRTCPLRRAGIDAGCAVPTPPTSPRPRAERWLHVAISLASLIGWHALANLLNAIPDSNDDFGLF
jgi:hypothetical protein